MLKEFQEFINRGGVVELAVGIIIGAAFTGIVSALVDNIISPIIGIVAGGVDFSTIGIEVGSAKLGIGAFIQAVIDFLIIAVVVFFLVKAYNNFMKRFEKPNAEEPAAKPRDEELLEEIRDLLARRPA